VFWEDLVIHDQMDWLFKTAPGFTNIGPSAGAQVNNPSVRDDNDAFFEDVKRGFHQKAAFGSVDFDIIPKRLTITAGTRYYNMNTTETGYSAGSFGCYEDGPPPCTGNLPLANNLTSARLSSTYTGFRSRANLSWKPTDDALLYYTWSQGFRPGGFNISSRVVLDGAYRTPRSYAPDTLINNELGWKTQWFDRRLQFNGAVYQEDWKNVQVGLFDPCCLGNVNFIVNGPIYRVRGVETEIVARVAHGLTATGSAAWNSSDLTNSPYLIGINGQPITSFPNPYGPTGSPLAQSPPFEGNLRIRYEYDIGEYQAFWQAGGTHQAHSYSAAGNIQIYDQASFSTYDASTGVSRGAWSLQVYGQNLTDTRANLFSSDAQFVHAEIVNRPRTVGLSYSFKF
jgi:iron complex outermembrane receptor protein